MNKEESIVREIRMGNKKELEIVYSTYKKPFIKFGRKYQVEEELVRDIYQDSVIILYENIRSGKLVSLKSSIKTYLFAIGKHKLIQHLRHTEKAIFLPLEEMDLLGEIEPYEQDDEDEQLTLIKKGYSQLGKKCQEILRMFYYEGKKLDEIQQSLNYDAKDTLKSQKSRCLKQLKDSIRPYE